jgi:hypothetical protein
MPQTLPVHFSTLPQDLLVIERSSSIGEALWILRFLNSSFVPGFCWRAAQPSTSTRPPLLPLMDPAGEAPLPAATTGPSSRTTNPLPFSRDDYHFNERFWQNDRIEGCRDSQTRENCCLVAPFEHE